MVSRQVFSKKVVFHLLLGLFSLGGQTLCGQAPEGITPQQQEAYNAILTVEQQNRYATSLPVDLSNALPMGIKRTINNIEYVVAFTHAEWTTSGYVLSAFARVKIPEQGKMLFFATQDIQFKEGNIVGGGRLALLGDVGIPFNGNTAMLTLKGNMDQATGLGGDFTYMQISCKGFEELKITADLEFSSDIIVPVDANGEAMPGATVKTSFTTVVNDWNDILLDVTLPPFTVKDLKGFVFNINHAVFDFSDFHNSPAMAFPKGYDAYLIPGNTALWRGVYVRDLSVTLPEYFSNKNQPEKRISFAAHDLLLDNNGVSGLFEAVNLLSIDEGSASGWRFSVDRFAFGFMANAWQEASFSGAIGLPVSDGLLSYTATFSLKDEYNLEIGTLNTLNFDLFHAKAQIEPNSSVKLRLVNGAFRPEAMLYGSLSIATSLGGDADTTKKPVQFNGIVFEGLFLSTQAPYFAAEYLGYNGEMKLANFPVSLTEIALHASGDQVALQFGLQLTLADKMFSAGTKLSIAATRYEEESIHRWRYRQTDVERINLNASVNKAFTIKGYLDLRTNDPIYGDGFAGSLELELPTMNNFSVKATAVFGKTDFRYWFVDAKVSLGVGVVVFPPAFFLNGFAGGAYYRMRRDGLNAQASPTGTTYVPDADAGLGLKAGVMFYVANSSAVQGEASFEMAFNRQGGLDFIGFFGMAQFAGKIPGAENVGNFVADKFTKLNEFEKKLGTERFNSLEKLKLSEPGRAAEEMKEISSNLSNANLAATVGIQYNFKQQCFDATFDLYANVAGGLLRGRGEGNKAGWGKLHIDANEWYLHMGTPDARLGIVLSLGGLINVETGGYFMIGHGIPEAPAPPEEVVEKLKKLGFDASAFSSARNLEDLADGKGFATGMDFGISTGDMTFLILYANFEAGFGFDIMMKDMGQTPCEGHTGALGINGWYAQGQTYVYLEGELGVKVNLWFMNAKIPIISGSAAALVQAKLPNPVWIAGYLGVDINVLGGLVTGHANFKLAFGEECKQENPGGSPVNMAMISDLTPAQGSDDVDVFTAPQAAFNMAVDKEFTVEDDEGEKIYRIQLEEFVLLDNGQPVQGKIKWNSNNDLATFYPHEVMPSTKKLTATVKVRFEQKRNNRWDVVYTGGQKAIEHKETGFTTGTAPNYIPPHNIAYAYPVVSQQFMMKDELYRGYIQLKQGQNYLFPSGYRKEIQVNSTAGTQIIPFTYDVGKQRIDYTLTNLALNRGYTIDVVTMPVTAGAGGADAGSQSITTEEDSTKYSVYSRTAADVMRSDVAFSVLHYGFQTGSHATFADKMKGLTRVRPVAGRINNELFNLKHVVADSEPFEPAELAGNDYSDGALVRPTAVLTDVYYVQDIHPLIYKNYPPAAGIKIEDRDPDDLGVPPVRAVYPSPDYLTEVQHDNYSNWATKRFPFVYNLFQVYHSDFIELRHKLTDKFVNTSSLSHYSYIVSKIFPRILPGTYKVKFQYHLPGGIVGTSAEFDYINLME